MGVLYEIIRRATKRPEGNRGGNQESTAAARAAEALLRLSNRKAELERLHQYGGETGSALQLQRKPEV